MGAVSATQNRTVIVIRLIATLTQMRNRVTALSWIVAYETPTCQIVYVFVLRSGVMADIYVC